MSLACLASVVMEQGRLDEAMANCKRAEEVRGRAMLKALGSPIFSCTTDWFGRTVVFEAC